MSDGFILGAGFSKAISPHMPLLGELGEALGRHVTVHSTVAGGAHASSGLEV